MRGRRKSGISKNMLGLKLSGVALFKLRAFLVSPPLRNPASVIVVSTRWGPEFKSEVIDFGLS